MKILNFATASPDRPVWEKTEAGFLRCHARILAERVMPYRREELTGFVPMDIIGDPIHMLVNTESMGNPDALRSLEAVPLVAGDHHWLDVENVRQYAVGAVAGTPRMDGPYLVCDMLVTDPATIESIEAGDLPEISAAYTADILFEPGSFDGQRYEGLQQTLRFNHLACIPAGHGRAGADVRILNEKGTYAMNLTPLQKLGFEPLPKRPAVKNSIRRPPIRVINLREQYNEARQAFINRPKGTVAILKAKREEALRRLGFVG